MCGIPYRHFQRAAIVQGLLRGSDKGNRMKSNKTIEAAILLSQMDTVEIERIGETTGVKLRLDPARSNGNFRVFRGCGDSNGAIVEVECRTTRVKGAAKGTLIYIALNERLAPTGSEVTSRLGKPQSIQQATGSAIYAYEVPGGELRFAVKTGSPEAVLSIALEKTPSAQSAASRTAKWGSADLTPVSS
jgi:hypothetical protein